MAETIYVKSVPDTPERVTIQMDRSTAIALKDLCGAISIADDRRGVKVGARITHSELRPHTSAIFEALSSAVG